MGVVDWVRERQKLNRQGRVLRDISRSLLRIADALERAYPAAQPVIQTPDITVEDVDAGLQAEYELAADRVRQRLGRQPTEEEILAEHSQIAHLLPGGGRSR